MLPLSPSHRGNIESLLSTYIVSPFRSCDKMSQKQCLLSPVTEIRLQYQLIYIYSNEILAKEKIRIDEQNKN